MKMKIAAVGSSRWIANEIRSAVEFIIGNSLPLHAYCTNEIQSDCAADFYICAQTQFKILRRCIPADKLFVLDLTPTAQFFIEVARIPAGETVYIFNNQMEYTSILSAYCRSLGIDRLDFLPIAYEEMPEEEIIRRLQNARYVIGVDRFMGKDVLLSARYLSYLREDVRLIAGARAASVRSACNLLQGIAARFHEQIAVRQADLAKALRQPHEAPARRRLFKEAAALLASAESVVQIIQTAALRSLVKQISVGALPASPDAAPVGRSADVPDGDSGMQQTLASIAELNHVLLTLIQKLQKISFEQVC